MAGSMLAQAAGSRAAAREAVGCVQAVGGCRQGLVASSSSGLRQVSWRWQAQKGAGALKAGGKRSSSSAAAAVRCKVPNIGESEFEEVVLNSELPVLVDFWAGWCGPCKLVATSMDVVERKYEGKMKVVKVETDPNPTLVKKYKVHGLPTLILFQDGHEIPGSRREGAISLAKLESMLKAVLPSLAAA